LTFNDSLGSSLSNGTHPPCDVDPDSAMTPKIAYFAHDLADPAVHRRVRMLMAGGAAVTAIGFHRSAEAPSAIEGLRPVDLGRTTDGILGRRILSVAGTLVRLAGIGLHVRGANVILARNLEMLVLAVRARRRYAPEAALVYECLDIHRILLSKRLGEPLRLLESKLWRDVDLLLTSSPAFIRNYFAPRGFRSPIQLVANKVLMVGESDPGSITVVRPLPGPPWRIGWFGMIRCRKSLAILSSLARASGGAIELVIRGQPSGATFSDFDAALAGLPNVQYAGPYRNPTDLPSMYGDVHFNWTIDYYESGQNSAWLLPNRVYEGSLYGAVPIALAGVETGHWLAERGAGVILDEPLEQKLVDFFRRLDQVSYARLARGIEALPRADLVSGQSDCRELVETLCRSSATHSQALRGYDVTSVAVRPKSNTIGA
jgi:succinoglycan biosynthesis protein ExoL